MDTPHIAAQSSRPRPRWARFSLRTMALLFVLISVALLLPRQRSFTQHYAAKQLNREGVFIFFRDDREPQSFWSRVAFGDDTYDFVDIVRIEEIALSQADIASLGSFRGVETCVFYNCPTTDAALKAVKKMTSVETLHIEGSTITSGGVNQLRGLQHLNNLRILDTSLTGVELEFLYSLPRLQTLSLSGDSVDDELIRGVARCSQLHFLVLRE